MGYTKKALILSLFILILMIPINSVAAFSFTDYLDEGDSIFFLVALRENETLHLKVNYEPQHNFSLFLFDSRPTESNVNPDATLNPKIFKSPPTVAYNLSDQPSINYNATKEQIYYIQLILIKNGSALFTLISNKELSRYYLPQISGYPLLVISSIVVIFSTIFIFKKRKSIFFNEEKD